MYKKTIAVDIDDVTVDFVPTFLAYHNHTHKTRVKLDDVCSFHLHKVLNIDTVTLEQRVLEFVRSPWHGMIPPMPGAVDSLAHLSTQYELHNVTSRVETYSDETHILLQTLFPPTTFKRAHFTNGFGEHHGLTKQSKGEVCRKIRAPVLIEDALTHAQHAVDCGVTVLLFDRPWNRDCTPGGMIRVHTWKQIVTWIETYMKEPVLS